MRKVIFDCLAVFIAIGMFIVLLLSPSLHVPYIMIVKSIIWEVSSVIVVTTLLNFLRHFTRLHPKQDIPIQDVSCPPVNTTEFSESVGNTSESVGNTSCNLPYYYDVDEIDELLLGGPSLSATNFTGEPCEPAELWPYMRQE